MSYLNKHFNQGKIIFFDLEVDTPQDKKDFKYNPYDKNSRFLGASFLIADPKTDFKKDAQILDKIKTHIVKDYKNEKEILLDIYKSFNQVIKAVKNDTKDELYPILCGIGITSSDLPILIELLKKHDIISNEEAFSFQANFRIIDLAILSIPLFGNASALFYPKLKNELINLFFPEKEIKPEVAISNLYDKKDFDGIKIHIEEEVNLIYECYKQVRRDFDFTVMLKSEYKKRKKSRKEMGIKTVFKQ